MEYREKIEHAERIAEELQSGKTTEEIKSELSQDGLYNADITAIFTSVRNIIGEKYQDNIEEHLLNNKPIKGSEVFSSLDDEMIDDLTKRVNQKLELAEKKKLTRLMKQGVSLDEITNQIDSRFLTTEKAAKLYADNQTVMKENGGGQRTLYFLGGIGLLVLTLIILFASGRLFFYLPFIAIGLIIKGFTVKRIAFED